MKVPKNCGKCNFYDEDKHFCKLLKMFVCNVNSCSSWMPSLSVMRVGRNVEFVPYEQYRMQTI